MRKLRHLLFIPTHHEPRVGDFSNGDSIRREPIVIDQYGEYAIPYNVPSGSELTSLS